MKEHTYSTPQELVIDGTEQLSRKYNLVGRIEETEEEIEREIDGYELFDLLCDLPEGQSLPEEDEFAATYYHFLGLEHMQGNMDIVFRAVYAA